MKLHCRLRDARGDLTLGEMVERTGIAQPYLSQIEAGRLLPKDKWIKALERGYGLPAEQWYPAKEALALELGADEGRRTAR